MGNNVLIIAIIVVIIILACSESETHTSEIYVHMHAVQIMLVSIINKVQEWMEGRGRRSGAGGKEEAGEGRKENYSLQVACTKPCTGQLHIFDPINVNNG